MSPLPFSCFVFFFNFSPILSSDTAGPIAPTLFPVVFSNFLRSQTGTHHTLQSYLSCFRFHSDFHHSSFVFFMLPKEYKSALVVHLFFLSLHLLSFPSSTLHSSVIVLKQFVFCSFRCSSLFIYPEQNPRHVTFLVIRFSSPFFSPQSLSLFVSSWCSQASPAVPEASPIISVPHGTEQK